MERNNSSTCSQQPDVAAGALRRLEVLYVGGQRGERVRVGRGASCPGRPARVCAWCPDISSRCTRHHLAAHAVCPGSMCWVGNHTCAGATTHVLGGQPHMCWGNHTRQFKTLARQAGIYRYGCMPSSRPHCACPRFIACLRWPRCYRCPQCSIS